jgi:hypothetical protein
MAAYPKPNNTTGTFNNQSFVNPDTGGLTIDEAKQYFVTFPTTQSPSTIVANNLNTTGALNVAGDSQFGGDVEFIGGVSITGLITFENDVEVVGTTTLDDTFLALSTAEIDGELTVNNNIILNYDPAFPTVKTFIQFSDLTVQDTAFVDANYAQKNESNTFEAGFTQTFDGIVDLGDSASASGLTLNNNTLSYLLQPRLSGTDYGLTVINALSNNSILSLSNGGSNVISMTCTGPQILDIAGAVGVDNLTISNPAGAGSTTFNYYTPNNFSLNMSSTSETFFIQYPGVNIMTFGNTEIDSFKNINMNSYNITDIGALAGITGVVTVNSAISMGSGNAININNSTLNLYSGTIATNIGQSAGQVYFNNTAPFANSPSFSFALYKSGGFTSVLDLSPTTVALTTQLNMNSQNIINCNSITDVSGQYTTTNTPPDNTITTAIATTGYVATAISNIPIPDLTNYAQLTTTNSQTFTGYLNFSNQVFAITQANNTNNTTLATTAFVKNNAGIYTQTSITATSSVYYSITPSPVNVISTYTSANNVVSFNSVPFNIVVGTVSTFLLATLNFSSSPFPGAPPATTSQTISMYCSNGATYAGTINWISATQVYIGPPAGIPLSSGMTFSVNLSQLGAFTP